MTVTTDYNQLEAAAARETILGNHAYAAALYKEASDNAPKITPAQLAHVATLPALVATVVAKSQIVSVKGHDGKTLTG